MKLKSIKTEQDYMEVIERLEKVFDAEEGSEGWIF